MSNYHVYISIISKPRYTSTASCWFTIWKLNKLVVKTEFNSAFTKGAIQAFICSRWLHNLSTGPTLRGAQAAPGVGPAREGHPEPLSTSHLPSPTSASPAPHSGQPQQSPPCSAWNPKPNPGLGESSLWDSKQQLRNKMWVPKIRDRAFYDQIYLIKFHCLLYCQSQWLPKETKHCTSTTRFSQIFTTSPNPWKSQGPFPMCCDTWTMAGHSSSTEPWGSRVLQCPVCAMSVHSPAQPPAGAGQTTPELTQRGNLTHHCGAAGHRWGSASVHSTRTRCTAHLAHAARPAMFCHWW